MIKMLVCDFDGTISGGDPSGIDKLNHYITQTFPLNFVVATGRTFSSIQEALSNGNFPTPKTIVSDIGTCIQHMGEKTFDRVWSKHVDVNWQRDKIQQAIERFPFVGQQSSEHQSHYKITLEGQL